MYVTIENDELDKLKAENEKLKMIGAAHEKAIDLLQSMSTMITLANRQDVVKYEMFDEHDAGTVVGVNRDDGTMLVIERQKLAHAEATRLQRFQNVQAQAKQLGLSDSDQRAMLEAIFGVDNAAEYQHSQSIEPSKKPTRRPVQAEQARQVKVGDIVWFCPPQDCKGEKTLEKYAAIVTQVLDYRESLKRHLHKIDGSFPLVELCTFGPNSVYFQHSVPFSETLRAGCWSWRDEK